MKGSNPSHGCLSNFFRKKALSAIDLEEAFAFGRLYGLMQWFNPSSVMEDDDFEQRLFKQHAHAMVNWFQDSGAQTYDWLHVTSDVYDVGGHTRLIEFFLRFQRSRKAEISVIATRKLTSRFQGICSELGVQNQSLEGSSVDRFRTLVDAGRKARSVALHIHPDDIVAALAARLLCAEGRQVFFLNHADHVFSFGPGAVTAVLEVSGFGWRMTQERRRARAQHFIGIPVLVEDGLMSDEIVSDAPIITIGDAQKYQPRKGYDFPGFAARLLDRTDRDLELVGPDGSELWWQALHRQHGSRVSFLGQLPYTEMRRRLERSACYLDSFPMTGGTIFTEALAMGKTVFGPPNTAAGYGLADATRAPSIDKLLGSMVNFLENGITPSPSQARLRQKLRDAFSEMAVGSRLEAAQGGDYASVPPELLVGAFDLDRYITSAPVRIPLPRRGDLSWRWRMSITVHLLLWQLRGVSIHPFITWRGLLRWINPVSRFWR